MKIILAVPGHLKTVPMNGYVLATLQSLGHEVRVFDFGHPGLWARALKKFSQAAFTDWLHRRLLRLADAFQPEVFLTIFGMDLKEPLLKTIRRRGVITICWWLNDPFQLRRSLAQAPWYDYYFTNARGCLPLYREAGVPRVFYLPVGCYPEVHRRREQVEKTHAVCFAGDWSPGREEMLSVLARDFPVAIWGPWKKHLAPYSELRPLIVKDGFFTPGEMAEIFNRSLVVLNIHTWYGKWDCGVNPRVFEANGCGVLQLCDFKEEIPGHYLPDQEIVLYRSLPELKDRLAWYLDHPEAAREVGFRGSLRTHREHTYAHRLKEMFALCGLAG